MLPFVLEDLFESLREEGPAMVFTMEDFNRQYIKEHFLQLTPEEQRETLERMSHGDRRKVLQLLPADAVLASLSAEQIQEIRDQLLAGGAAQPRKSKRKK